MKITTGTVILATALLFAPLVTDASSSLEPTTQGDVEFVSGGVGDDEQQQIRAMRPHYNVYMMFAENTGEYLSGVNVQVRDTQGNSYVQTTADGPILMAKLKPGRYIVTAELDGKAFERKISTGHRQTSISFIWPPM